VRPHLKKQKDKKKEKKEKREREREVQEFTALNIRAKTDPGLSSSGLGSPSPTQPSLLPEDRGYSISNFLSHPHQDVQSKAVDV
jgi:superfamily II DNA/RNA helicase